MTVGIMPLEGLWWADDMTRFSPDDKAAWKWTMMIMQPEIVSAALIAEAIDRAARKKDLPSLPLARLDTLAEGRAAQILHLGPYSGEAPTIARLHAFIAGEGLKTRGRHHEIYLGDPRRTAPEKLKTIIRQPVDE